jgi:hypothetical protein
LNFPEPILKIEILKVVKTLPGKKFSGPVSHW